MDKDVRATRKLAEFVCDTSFDDLPNDTIKLDHQAILDSMGVQILAAKVEPSAMRAVMTLTPIGDDEKW